MENPKMSVIFVLLIYYLDNISVRRYVMKTTLSRDSGDISTLG